MVKGKRQILIVEIFVNQQRLGGLVSNIGIFEEIRGEHVPESDEYGITSFIYRSRKPMSGQRFEQFLETGIMKEQNVIRAKGSLWLDCCDTTIVVFDVAGASIEVNAEQEWFIEMKNADPEGWEAMDPEYKEAISKDFEGEQGDRRQEMVFIGTHNSQGYGRKLEESGFWSILLV